MIMFTLRSVTIIIMTKDGQYYDASMYHISSICISFGMMHVHTLYRPISNVCVRVCVCVRACVCLVCTVGVVCQVF